MCIVKFWRRDRKQGERHAVKGPTTRESNQGLLLKVTMFAPGWYALLFCYFIYCCYIWLNPVKRHPNSSKAKLHPHWKRNCPDPLNIFKYKLITSCWCSQNISQMPQDTRWEEESNKLLMLFFWHWQWLLQKKHPTQTAQKAAGGRCSHSDHTMRPVDIHYVVSRQRDTRKEVWLAEKRFSTCVSDRKDAAGWICRQLFQRKPAERAVSSPCIHTAVRRETQCQRFKIRPAWGGQQQWAATSVWRLLVPELFISKLDLKLKWM